MSAAPICKNVIKPEDTEADNDFEAGIRLPRSRNDPWHPQVDYVVRAQWGETYVVDVTVTLKCANHPNRINRFGVNGWTFEFSLNPEHKISKIWNGELRQDGLKCTVLNKKFCSPIMGRAVFYFGFESRICVEDKSPTFPSSVIVNGKVCEVNACYARDLADCAFDYVAESRSPSPSPPASRGTSPEPAPTRRAKSAPAVLQVAPFRYARSRFSALIEPCPEADSRRYPTSEAASLASTPLDEERCPTNRDSSPSPRSPQSSLSVEQSGARHQVTDKNESGGDLTCCMSQISPSQSSSDIPFSGSSCVKILRKRKANVLDSGSATADESESKSYCVVPRTLEVDYYRRSEQVKKRKFRHMDWIDATFKSREKLVLATVLNEAPIVLEPNMFPYDTPYGVSHWTLWSKCWLKDHEIEEFVGEWLQKNMPEAVEWNFDDNMSDGLSINLFHVHVYIKSA